MYAVRHFPACTLCQRYHMTSSAWRSDDGHKLGGSWSCSSLQLYMHVRTKLSFHVLSCHACLPVCASLPFLFYYAESIKAMDRLETWSTERPPPQMATDESAAADAPACVVKVLDCASGDEGFCSGRHRKNSRRSPSPIPIVNSLTYLR